ncbi:unnamed protein product [Lactuca saligna]|uniref:Uncharacterized protein n=1 Tax=Lactuca saligna TaxID=75948 RepID=A0AA35ZB03_LACSI|nr:unnamed protein product [Lactuca saligna]
MNYRDRSVDMVVLKKHGVSQCYQQGSVSMLGNKSRPQPSLNQSLLLRHKKCPVQVLCSQKKDIPIVEARTMDKKYDTLAERVVPTAASGTNTSAMLNSGLELYSTLTTNVDKNVICAYRNALSVFKGTTWFHIQDHVHLHIGIRATHVEGLMWKFIIINQSQCKNFVDECIL